MLVIPHELYLYMVMLDCISLSAPKHNYVQHMYVIYAPMLTPMYLRLQEPLALVNI